MPNNKYEKILAVAANLISTNGYEGTSLQTIADKVGLHKSTLFHYVKSKEELLIRIFERSINEVSINLDKISTENELDPEEKLREAMENHLALLIEYFDSSSILNQMKILPKKSQARYLEGRRKYEKDFEKIVVEMKRKGYFKGLDAKIVTFGLLGMLNWVPRWYKIDGRLSRKEISNILFKMIVKK